MPLTSRSVFSVVSALAVFALPTSGMAAAANASQFCDQREVHPEAVKLSAHGVDLLIYPNAQAINADFSGCQKVWLADGFLLAQATYRNGEVSKYVGNSPDSSRTVSCLYEARRLLASAGDCPAFESFPLGKSGGVR